MFGLSKPEKKILVPVLSILLGLCTLAYYAHRYSQRLIVASQSIEEAEDIKNHIKEIQTISVDMENEIRGFVLTGDEQFLPPHQNASSEIIIHLHQLGEVPNLSAHQAEILTELRKLVDEKTAMGTRMIELRRQKGMQEALALTLDGKEKILMDQIRSLTGQMLTMEDSRLLKLREEQHKAIHHFALTYYFLLLKIAITVCTVLTLLVLYFRRRNKTERLLQASKELFHNVLDHTYSCISIKDLSGRFILMNKAYENAFNLKEEEVKGKTVFDIFNPQTAQAIRNHDIEVIRLQQQMKMEEVVRESGEPRHFVSLKFPLFDAHHIPYAVCSISTDETEKIQSEQQHQEEMKRILDLFNNAPCGYQATDENGIVIEINETLLKWLGYSRKEVIGKMLSRDLISPDTQHQFAYYFPKIKSGELKSVFDVEVNYVRKNGSHIAIVANSIGQYDDDGRFLYTRTSVFDVSYRKQVEGLLAHN